MWNLTHSVFARSGFLPLRNHLGNIFREVDAGGKRIFHYFAHFGGVFAVERGYRSLTETHSSNFVAIFNGVGGSETLRK